jgi:hypothetical protein
MALHVNRTGVLILTLLDSAGAVLDISTATTKEILIDGVAKAASFVTTGTDGKIKYTIAAGENTASENRRAVGHVVLADGSDYSTDDYYFWVAP